MFDLDNMRRELFKLQEQNYKEFESKLIPTVDKEFFIGIRTPVLCKFVKKFFQDKDAQDFLNELPHKYFEENSIHALLISEIKNFDECLRAIKNFLPYVDNWATCDSISPKIFKQHTDELDAEILNWLHAEQPYAIRFGLSMLMKFYLDEKFTERYLEQAAKVDSDDYYVKMMAAWFFATALAKHFDVAIKFLTERRLPKWIHNKTIQKALESRRITAEQKIKLRGLRIK